MVFSVTIESNTDISKKLSSINDKDFWTFAATTWWQLYTPYIPMQTGALALNVKITPGAIEHVVPYAQRMYTGNFNFRKNKHPLASKEWDKAAMPTQKSNLISAMQGYIDKGGLNLSGR